MSFYLLHRNHEQKICQLQTDWVQVKKKTIFVRRTTLKYIVANVLVIITTYEGNRVNISIELQIKNQAKRLLSKFKQKKLTEVALLTLFRPEEGL